MHKWFTASGEHVFWSEICNNVSYVANHDPLHKVIVSPRDCTAGLNLYCTVILSLTSSIAPYEELHYYGKVPVLPPVTGAVQTALFIEEYSSLIRCNPSLTICHSEHSKGLAFFVKNLLQGSS